jgi:hypothetical protein
MTHSPKLRRREALVVLGWWLSLGPALGAQARRPGKGAAQQGDLLQRLLPHEASAVAVGSRFLEEQPQEADSARLRQQLGLPAGASLDAEEMGDQKARLHAIHREDFQAGRVFELDGWTLSLTELRLAALVALGLG